MLLPVCDAVGECRRPSNQETYNRATSAGLDLAVLHRNVHVIGHHAASVGISVREPEVALHPCSSCKRVPNVRKSPLIYFMLGVPTVLGYLFAFGTQTCCCGTIRVTV